MMGQDGHTPDLDRLIGRHLDGELTDEQRLQLDREVIRDPDARRRLDDEQRIDALAASALNDLLGRRVTELDPNALPAQHRPLRRRRVSWTRMLVPGAVAAGLLGLAIARWPLTPSSVPVIADRGGPIPTIHRGALKASRPEGGLFHNAGHSRNVPSIKRHTGRELFGVIGDDGNIYWIGVDRTRTIRQPRLRSTPDM
ncbi:MAG: anti-sigma factor family protein [Phycisphaerae bacterium]